MSLKDSILREETAPALFIMMAKDTFVSFYSHFFKRFERINATKIFGQTKKNTSKVNFVKISD